MAIEFVDAGWGDWRLRDAPNTRVTQSQMAACERFGPDAIAGACEVRYGDQTGELLIEDAGRLFEVGEGGTTVDVTDEYARSD